MVNIPEVASCKDINEIYRDPGTVADSLISSPVVAGAGEGSVPGTCSTPDSVFSISGVQRRMAPLQTALADTTLKNQTNTDEAEFQGHVDPSWRVISIPHGGVNYSVQDVANGLLKWFQGTYWGIYFARLPNSRVQPPTKSPSTWLHNS